MTWNERARLTGDTLASLILGSDGTLYAGGGAGSVWRSLDGGVTWRPYTTIPDPESGAILSMAIGPDRIFYIGTEHRGIWKADMDQIGSVGEGRIEAVRLDLQ